MNKLTEQLINKHCYGSEVWALRIAAAAEIERLIIDLADTEHRNSFNEDQVKAKCKHIENFQVEIERLTIIEIAVTELEPYFDQLICYTSTTSEYKPNLLVKNMREALAGTKNE